MTRETKVGLVVAASFLCLVGVVVASRLGRNTDKNESQAVAQASTPQHDGDPKPLPGNKPDAETPKKDLHPKPRGAQKFIVRSSCRGYEGAAGRSQPI